ncbi:MAG: phosphoribosylamine--glycine ligase [Acidimicrobiales bacterium]
MGSGGREHALARAISKTADVVVAPGNPAMTGFERSSAPPEQIEADLWVIGPEAPLVGGLADRIRARGGLVFGPGADGARLEGSKAWMKELLFAARVPTARSQAFDEPEPALRYLRSLPGPWVVKTDGLAAGKGVLVTSDIDEAARDIEEKLSGRAFGQAGRRVVVEEGLSGQELSVMAICDGRRAYPLAAAQDHKRLGNGGTGPNTGGMGAFSPVPAASDSLVDEVMERAVLPTLHALYKRGIDYRGALYAGLMLTEDGPKVLEFNVRFGDPEAQVVLPRWDGDVAVALLAAARGQLSDRDAPSFSSQAAVCVVLAAPGYPSEPRTGSPIEGLEEARALKGVEIYAAGVAEQDGRLVTAGGRVLGVTGLGKDLAEARRLAYHAADLVSWPGMVRRDDIAELAK